MKALPTKFNYQITSGRLIITFGFFLIGMYAGRKKWFENLDTLKPFVKKVWKTVSFSLLGLIGLTLLVVGGSFMLGINIRENQWIQWFLGLMFDFFNSGLTFFYISGLTLLMYRTSWKRILSPLAPIGKMALTSYLMQTFFGLMIFCSFGLALFTEISPGINALLSIGLFLLQVVISKAWLRYFSYGPMEWIWRALTFFKFPPMLRKHQVIKEASAAPMLVEK
jgi:uncharacterized protein